MTRREGIPLTLKFLYPLAMLYLKNNSNINIDNNKMRESNFWEFHMLYY